MRAASSWAAMRSSSVQIVFGELPFERCGDLFVVLLEVEQSGLDLVEGVEVVG